jgi:hypothetical protein
MKVYCSLRIESFCYRMGLRNRFKHNAESEAQPALTFPKFIKLLYSVHIKHINNGLYIYKIYFLPELILAEGAGLRGGYSTPETLSNRDRCR